MIRNCGEVGLMLQKIMRRLLANQNLLKLLYYTDKDPLNQPDLTQDEIQDKIFEKLIKIVPKVGAKETATSLVAIQVNNGRLTDNAEFRRLSLSFQVLVPFTQWIVKNDNLRPFLIMGEIENSLKGKVIDGIGKMSSEGFDLNFLSDEITCYEMDFSILNYD